MRCHNCNQTGHAARDCNGRCSNCNCSSHAWRDCRQCRGRGCSKQAASSCNGHRCGACCTKESCPKHGAELMKRRRREQERCEQEQREQEQRRLRREQERREQERLRRLVEQLLREELDESSDESSSSDEDEIPEVPVTRWRKGEVVQSYARSSGERSDETCRAVVLESRCSTDDKIKLYFASSSDRRGEGKTQRVPTEWVRCSHVQPVRVNDQVKVHYRRSNNNRSSSGISARVLEALDSDGEIKVRHKVDGEEEYVPAHWVVKIKARASSG